ncbi:MAG: mevalonate kinase [Anaerolineae bacterium]|nr:mevalonate kinase [Anaerolineae bacterium]
MTVAYACGKVILFGEHAVVYGQPAIAVPVTQVRVAATVEDASSGEGVTIVARNLDVVHRLGDSIQDDGVHPLDLTVRNTFERIGLSEGRDLLIEVSSTIPIARGMGSGAAVATAIVRALSAHFGAGLTASDVSELVYKTEILHHGTPSGIDNSVIAFERPVYFVKGEGPQAFEVGQSFSLVIADTGASSSTREVVRDVRDYWMAERERYDTLFADVGSVAMAARASIARGDTAEAGRLMNVNQALLEEIGVSSAEIRALVEAARQAGDLGAKLSGAGRGGNVIALVTPAARQWVTAALQSAGAIRVIATEVV